MRHNGPGSGAIHSLSQTWSNESRGVRLTPDHFETKTRIHTGDNPVEAILVLPAAILAGHNGEQIIAEYPLYAVFAVDRQNLDKMSMFKLDGNRHMTLADAVRHATTLNCDSENAYLNDYQQGRLTAVKSWQKTEPKMTGPNDDNAISIKKAANNMGRF